MLVAKIFVCLKPNVLDPQGKAVCNSLQQLGYTNVIEARVSKYIELTFDSDNEESTWKETDKICQELLANPNTEHYWFTLENKEEGQS